MNQQSQQEPELDKLIVVILLVAAALFCTNKCMNSVRAQSRVSNVVAVCDTIVCYNNSIQSIIIDEARMNGHIVYENKEQNIADVIPVNKTVMKYIILCMQNKVHANLGIVMKNNVASRVIRYSPYQRKPRLTEPDLIIAKTYLQK